MNHSRLRNIVIDLTSLLDVVMILVFAVLIKNSEMAEISEQELIELQAENERLKMENEDLGGVSEQLKQALAMLDEGNTQELLEKIQNAESKVSAYDYMDDIIVVYTVDLQNKYNGTTRCLSFGDTAGEQLKIYTVKKYEKEEWNKAINFLKVDIKEFVDSELEDTNVEKYVYIIFSYGNIYEKDYEEINKILSECETRYGIDKVRYRIEKH